MDDQSRILAKKLVIDGCDASPDTVARAKENIARSIASEHKNALRDYYRQYSELSIFLYCVLSLVLALLVIGLMGSVIAALSSVAPPVMAILILSPQTLVTVFIYSFSSLVGLFGLSFLLKRPLLLSANHRAQVLYQQELEEAIDSAINRAAKYKIKGALDDYQACRESVLLLQARLQKDRTTGFFGKLYLIMHKILRAVSGHYTAMDPEYFDARVQKVLCARYTKARQHILGSTHPSRIQHYLAPYNKLGFNGPGQPSYKQVAKTVTVLHRRLYLLEKEILSSPHEPDLKKVEKRKMYTQFLREQETLRRQLWHESIPVVGRAVGWIRKSMLAIGLWPSSYSEASCILQKREKFLEKSCLYLLEPDAIRRWYKYTINWATEEKYLWSIPERRFLFGFFPLQGERQVTREEYQAAERGFIRFLQGDKKGCDNELASLQRLGGEECDSQAYMKQYTKTQLLRWLRIISSDDDQGGEGSQEGHEEYESVYKMCPGENQAEKEKFLRDKLTEIEHSGFWHRFLIGIGWRSGDAIARLQLDRESKEDAIMESRNRKACKDVASLDLQEEHVEDIERWRLRKLLGSATDNSKKIDYEKHGLYRPEEIEKIAEDFNNTRYFSYLYQVFYTLSATKLHKTLDVYECKLSCQMAAYGYLDAEHKKLLEAMDTVREKLKKDENIDIFRDMIYPFTLLQGVFAAMASSVVEPIFGGAVLTTVSAAGLVNNMRTKGRRDIATLGFCTTLLMGIGIIAIQSVLLAGVTFSGAAVAVGVLASVGGTLSFLTWVVRGAKRSIDSEKNINPRISMATRKCFAIAVELDDVTEMDEELKRWVFDENVTQAEAKKRLKQAGINPSKSDWIWKKRDQFLDAKAYIRLLCRQQTNLIRTIKNGVNKDVELGIISERCEKISRAYDNNVLSKEAAESMLQPLLHAKTVQENHTNRNYLYIWVSMPAVTVGFIALSSIVFPIAPLLLATVLVGVQITAIGVFSLIHLHQYSIGSKGIFYQKEPSAEEYLHRNKENSLTVRQEGSRLVKRKLQILLESQQKERKKALRKNVQRDRLESTNGIEMVDLSHRTKQDQVLSGRQASDEAALGYDPEDPKKTNLRHKRKS